MLFLFFAIIFLVMPKGVDSQTQENRFLMIVKDNDLTPSLLGKIAYHPALTNSWPKTKLDKKMAKKAGVVLLKANIPVIEAGDGNKLFGRIYHIEALLKYKTGELLSMTVSHFRNGYQTDIILTSDKGINQRVIIFSKTAQNWFYPVKIQEFFCENYLVSFPGESPRKVSVDPNSGISMTIIGDLQAIANERLSGYSTVVVY